MTTVQKRLVAIGASRQTALGAPAAQPQFWFGVTDGKPAEWEIDEDFIEVTGEDPLYGEVDRTAVVPGADFTALMHPKMLGLLLYGALGAIATTGAGTPWSHELTPAVDVPYLTFFGRAFDGDYLKTQDCKIDELELSWENAGHLEVAVTAMGVKLTWGTTPFTPGVNESVGGTPLFRAAGGTYKLSPHSGTPVAKPIISGSLKISNEAEGVPQSGSVEPSDIAVGVKKVEAAMNLAPSDLVDIRSALTGAPGGTEISDVPVYGSLEWKFIIDANTDLLIEVPRMASKIEMPEADPAGGFLEHELAGMVVQPAGGADALVATLRNDHEDYLV